MSPILVPQTQSAYHPHAPRNAFRHRDARQQSRSFARWNQSLRHSPNSSPLGVHRILRRKRRRSPHPILSAHNRFIRWSNKLPKCREATARAAHATTGEVSAYGRGAGVGRGRGVGVHLPVHGVGVGVGLGVAVAVAVAVGVGVGPD